MCYGHAMHRLPIDWTCGLIAEEDPRRDRPDCLRCGGACCKIDWAIAFDKDEPVPRWLSIPGRKLAGDLLSNERMMRKNADKSCIALENGRCTIYELRPTLCQEFETGSECCLEAMAVIGQAD